jgi:hypothetical protein
MSWFEQGLFLERYPAYGWVCGLFEKVPLGTEWDSGWIGKMPEVWCGLERYLICEKSCSNKLRTNSREYYGYCRKHNMHL